MTKRVRRLVTGHDSAGKSVYLKVEEIERVSHRKGVNYFEIWRTYDSPEPLTPGMPPPREQPLTLGPSPRGSVLRLLDLEPGHNASLPPRADGRHPGMHRTQTLDYGVVLEGEAYSILDDQEILVGPGDVVVQRGTDHAWENRSDKTCRIAFILLDAVFTPELSALIPDAHIQVGPLKAKES